MTTRVPKLKKREVCKGRSDTFTTWACTDLRQSVWFWRAHSIDYSVSTWSMLKVWWASLCKPQVISVSKDGLFSCSYLTRAQILTLQLTHMVKNFWNYIIWWGKGKLSSPRAAKKMVSVAEAIICTPDPTWMHKDIASSGALKTSPLTIFHPLSSKSSFGPAFASISQEQTCQAS